MPRLLQVEIARWLRSVAGCPVVADQHTGETVYVSAQFVSPVDRTDVVWYPDEVVQRCVKPVGVARYPAAKVGQQLAQLDRIGGVEAEKGAQFLARSRKLSLPTRSHGSAQPARFRREAVLDVRSR